jgi:hypothetical protein
MQARAGPGQAGTGGIKPDASTCNGPNPAGCFYNGLGCPTGQVFAQVGCTSSHCICEPAVGWSCTTDCGGGSCVDGSALKPCGGFAGATCGPTEWCDFDYQGINYCGGDDSSGICRAHGIS